MPNYAALQATALRLVTNAGRLMTFVQYNQTPANSSTPWTGPTDPRGSPVQSLSLPAVVVDVGTAQSLGIATRSENLLKRTTQFLIVAPGPGFEGDLKAIHEVIDRSTSYSVVDVGTLEPGEGVLLHYVAVGR